MEARSRVVIVGGGVSGLATAYYLSTLGCQVRPQVTLVEAGDSLGGKVRTYPLSGRPVDTGPDAFLARSPHLAALIDDLGLAGTVVPPAARDFYVYSRGRLRRMPAGVTFGVPEPLLPLLRSGLLSPLGVLRAGLDLVLPRQHLDADFSVGDLLRSRFGRQVFNRLVEPLLGGVHAGRADLLSANSTIPEIVAVARRHRSLYLGMRRRRAASPPAAGAPLVTLSGGLSTLTDALAARLDAADVRRRAGVVSLRRTPGGYRLGLASTTTPGAGRSASEGQADQAGTGAGLDAAAVVLATPAYVAADLLATESPALAEALREVPYVDVASVTLEYDRSVLGRPLDASGFLVPPEEGRLMIGCTWLSAKWAHLAGGPTVLIRGLVGRHGDQRWAALDDDDLARGVHEELAGALRLAPGAGPRSVHIQRWPRAMPQYTVGHADRLDHIDALLRAVPGVHLTGAAYRGVGLAGCVTQARQAAQAVLAGLAADARATEGAMS